MARCASVLALAPLLLLSALAEKANDEQAPMGMPPQGMPQPPMGQMPQQPAGMPQQPPQGMPQPPMGVPQQAAPMPQAAPANLNSQGNSQFPIYGGYPAYGYGYPRFGYGGYPGFGYGGYPSYGYGGYPAYGYGYGYPAYGYGYGYGYPSFGLGYGYASPMYGFGYETPAEPMFGAPPAINETESSTDGQTNFKFPYGDYTYPYAYANGFPTYGTAAMAMHSALFGAKAAAPINMMQSTQAAKTSVETQMGLSDYSYVPQSWLPYTSYVDGR